jgi:hypothetical protein
MVFQALLQGQVGQLWLQNLASMRYSEWGVSLGLRGLCGLPVPGQETTKMCITTSFLNGIWSCSKYVKTTEGFPIGDLLFSTCLKPLLVGWGLGWEPMATRIGPIACVCIWCLQMLALASTPSWHLLEERLRERWGPAGDQWGYLVRTKAFSSQPSLTNSWASFPTGTQLLGGREGPSILSSVLCPSYTIPQACFPSSNLPANPPAWPLTLPPARL